MICTYCLSTAHRASKCPLRAPAPHHVGLYSNEGGSGPPLTANIQAQNQPVWPHIGAAQSTVRDGRR